jgi:FMN phosphatase YigB (HAD superfamily)
MKIVVFDLDETLGYFTEYGIFWDSLVNYFKNKNKVALTQSDFDDILDLFPEFLRPNIINILTYLKEKKLSECCHKMMIYTNNNVPLEWANHIISYF